MSMDLDYDHIPESDPYCAHGSSIYVDPGDECPRMCAKCSHSCADHTKNWGGRPSRCNDCDCVGYTEIGAMEPVL